MRKPVGVALYTVFPPVVIHMRSSPVRAAIYAGVSVNPPSLVSTSR
ncbi:hypothetical protein SRIMM317S_02803 [Streptomyces rimosus subsp. rimosus]